MTALHDRSVATFQLIGRKLIGTIEGCRLTVGDVILIAELIHAGINTHLGLLYLTLGLHKGLDQLTAHIGELTVGDEISKIIRHVYLLALIDGIAQLRELTNQILARRLLGYLMFGRKVYRYTFGT